MTETKTVERNDVADLVQQGRARGLDAVELEDLVHVVAHGAPEVDLRQHGHLPQVGALGVQHPLLASRLKLARGRVKALHRRLLHEHLCNAAHAAQRHARQQAAADAPQERVILCAQPRRHVVVFGVVFLFYGVVCEIFR